MSDGHGKQVLGSLLAAVAIIAIAIAVVTAKFGETPAAELEAREEIAKERTERVEDRLEAAEERRERAGEQP
jgi:uncharacterized membrane protein